MADWDHPLARQTRVSELNPGDVVIDELGDPWPVAELTTYSDTGVIRVSWVQGGGDDHDPDALLWVLVRE